MLRCRGRFPLFRNKVTELSHSGFSQPLNGDNIKHNNGECLTSNKSEE